ncbi:glycosyltransferase [Romboutsia timonensis]|uniref:glycosyltransferase n=1 Tax=Romboutsia timonensis TaxID=1776391 RepID=UPI0008DA5624|nr:glycosyltransferase [Romboutsia timonensis]
MKVLQINAVNIIRSTGRTTKEIHDYLKKYGHESIVAYSEGPDCENTYKIGSTIEKKIHGLLSRLLGLQGYFSKIGTKNLINYIVQEKPDVVRLGNLHSDYINIPMVLKFLAKDDIPTVLTLDDCFFFTGKCCHYTADNCYKWKIGCKNCIRVHKDNNSWFLDRTKKMWKDKKNLYDNIPRLAVVGVSEWITREAKESILSSAKYIKTIYNWIDTDLFKPINTIELRKKLFLQNKFIILGVASGWSNSKGLNYFIELSKCIDDNHSIILVGNIPKSIELPNNIIHIQETNNVQELVQYYSMADVFLQLSLEETFGKVTAEALSCGTPVIVFDSTANPELVGYKCGYVANKSSLKDVVKYIECIKFNTKEYYSNSCREFALNNFNKEDRISDYINLFENLINVRE